MYWNGIIEPDPTRMNQQSGMFRLSLKALELLLRSNVSSLWYLCVGVAVCGVCGVCVVCVCLYVNDGTDCRDNTAARHPYIMLLFLPDEINSLVLHHCRAGEDDPNSWMRGYQFSAHWAWNSARSDAIHV